MWRTEVLQGAAQKPVPLEMNATAAEHCYLIWHVSQMQTQPGGGRAHWIEDLAKFMRQPVLQPRRAATKSVCELTCESGFGANWSAALT